VLGEVVHAGADSSLVVKLLLWSAYVLDPLVFYLCRLFSHVELVKFFYGVVNTEILPDLLTSVSRQ
jgi:hypothetical protein